MNTVQLLQREKPMSAIQVKRVAAYCRVSTDAEQQALSLETQMASFRELICSRPGWELAGIYADEGLTGTNASRRVMFQQMIADCEAGKIDYIITKSISRFARNTMDCLQYVRKLKDMGIYVYFDENRIDTGGMSSEIMLSILAAVAQEESHSISENMKWGIRKRFQAGKPKWVRTYGFAKGEDGEYHIDEEQAKGVKRIFELYVSGRSLPEIIRILERENIPSMNGGKWSFISLSTVLHNEKYAGDIMMQKTYTIDHLSHKKVKNDQTVVPSYYIRDHHEAIIDRNAFDMAQTIMSLKDHHKGCTQYPYYGTLICPICAGNMIRYRLPACGRPAVWACGNADCPPYVVHEKYIDRIMRDAYAKLDRTELKDETALDWLKRKPHLERIEYNFLNALVENITFSEWNEAVVTWKFGQKTEVPVEYAKASEIPNVEIAQTTEGYTANGKPISNGKLVQARVMRIIACCEQARKDNELYGRPRDVR